MLLHDLHVPYLL